MSNYRLSVLKPSTTLYIDFQFRDKIFLNSQNEMFLECGYKNIRITMLFMIILALRKSLLCSIALRTAVLYL